MATANPLREDNYVLELSRVREKIKTEFIELIDCLKTRESELLRELDNILASYLSYRSELEKVNEKKIALETTKTFLQNQLQTSPIKFVHENFITQLDTELKSIETPIETKMVSFECDSIKMLAELNNLGKLVEKVNGIDYKSKKQPLVSVCEIGNGMEQLNYPFGVTVDNETGNIFIADQCNSFVKVFDCTGKYLFKFGDNEGEGKMYLPLSVAICGDRILISQCNHCILNYQLNGKFISKIGRDGKGELEFICPFGLTIDELNGIFMLVIVIIIVFRFSLMIFVLYLSLVYIYSSTLVMLNSPENTFSFLINLILVSISLIIITFYRRVLFLEEKECK